MPFHAKPPRSSSRPSAATRRNRCRPALEQCEERALLTSYSVVALTDSGTGRGQTGDLRYCIARANADNQKDTITFAVTGTIQLGSALPTLTNARGIKIAGPGAWSLTVRGGGEKSDYSILKVKQGAAARIADLTLADGSAQRSGGGIFNVGRLTLSGVILTGNSARENGGAIYNAGPLTIIGSAFVDNNARHAGGGIYSLGPTTIVDSKFTSNSADFAGGGIETTYSTVKITGTTLDNNSAGITGGGISVDADRLLHDIGGKLTLINSTLSGNTAGDSNGRGLGGGLASIVSEVNIIGTAFTANTAGRDAGGIAIQGGDVSVDHSTFSGNKTGGNGGGILIETGVSLNGQYTTNGATLSIADSAFTGNTADRNGGAIDATLTEVKVKRATITGNAAGLSGGGVSLESNAPLTKTHGTLTLSNSTVNGNQAGRNGGGINNYDHVVLVGSNLSGNQAANAGGGIFNAKSLLVNQSTVTDNRPDNIARTS